MALFTVIRKVDGKYFLKNEDRICAGGWLSAYINLWIGIIAGRFDSTCRDNGMLIQEITVSDDKLLDIMIDNNQHKNIRK